MSTGTVKWFDSKKGFGFLLNNEGQDVFVHFSSIEGDGFRSLKDGERVEYDMSRGAKGLSAQHVRRMTADALKKSRSPAGMVGDVIAGLSAPPHAADSPAPGHAEIH